MYIPKYDKGFKPAIVELRNYEAKVNAVADEEKSELVICLERTKGYNYIYKMDIFKDGTGHDEENFEFVERIVKTILWIAGGYKIYVAGSKYLAGKIKEAYSKTGLRAFDFDFMTRVYEHEMEVIECTYDEIPELN